MGRGRAWRRHIEEKVVIRRLEKLRRSSWYGFKDVNGIRKQHVKIADYIGSNDQFKFKTLTTTKYDSYHKTKYSPNKNSDRWNRSRSEKTREFQKRLFLKILKENGLK